MHRIDGIENLNPPLPSSVVTIGKFFAVHRGHRALIETVCRQARERNVPGVVVTFDRHPLEILRPGTTFPLLASLEERLDLIETFGPDCCVVVRLEATFLGWSPEEFARGFLVQRLGAVEVVTGEDFRFGSGARGTLATLRDLGQQLGFDVLAIPPVLVDGVPVSSSRIAAELERGAVAGARRLLGRPYRIAGVVVEGDRRGRELGFPTANVAVPPDRLLPLDGVFAAWTDGPAGRRPAVVNIGTRPTVGGDRRQCEAHLLDFTGQLYGDMLSLNLIERLRDERRFPSLADLREQIGRDAATARQLLEQEPGGN